MQRYGSSTECRLSAFLAAARRRGTDIRGGDVAAIEDYWNDLNRRGDLSGVGQSGLPPSMNRWLYKAKLRRVGEYIGRSSLQPRRVYDVGAGIGFWSSYWRSLGADVAGCDFAPEAVRRLQNIGAFELLDISDKTPGGTYDLVWVADVLLHILDEARFRRALSHLAATVEPGGHLVMIEPIQVAKFRTIPQDGHSLARSVDAYVGPLESAGLKLVDLIPLIAVANNPIEASSRVRFWLWMAAWQLLKAPTRISPRFGSLMGRLAYLLDPIVLRLFGGVSSKLLVLRRPTGP